VAETMRQSPCATCKHGHQSKHKPRCGACERRIAYVDSLEPGVECRDDPAYQMSYSTPAIIRGQMPHAPISAWDLSF
jgi:hypothetical protein